MRFFKSIKFRLTVWYLVAILVLLSVFSAAAYLMLSRNLYEALDESLRTRVTELKATLAFEDGRAIFAGQPDELLQIYNANGVLLQRFGTRVELTGIDTLVKQTLSGQDYFLSTITRDGQEVRLYAALFTVDRNTRFVIIVGKLTADVNAVLATFRSVLVVSGLSIILLAGIGGWLLASRALKPVDRITRTAQEIGESDLSRRLNAQSEDELGRLSATLNGMIERLEAAFSRQRRFTADASHELRTPLAIMQAESSLALDRERTSAEYKKSLELISQEISYMSALIGKLLFLARSDAGKEMLNIERVNLKVMLMQLSADIEALARDKGLQFKFGPAEDLTVKGDKVKLRQMFLNLLENAVRYTPGGGSISVSVSKQNDMAVVSVSDTGIGISAEHLPHIFERFYRVDKARSRAEGGTGLGLAIAKNIAELHGGSIEVESQAGKGSTFYVLLPVAD